MVNDSENNMVAGAGVFKHEGKCGAKATALLIVDVQERLAPAVPAAPEVVPRILALIEKARSAGLPILATEQYSQGLGPSLAVLRDRLAAGEVVEKIHFAAPREAAFADRLRERGIGHCLVAGMEAHVCVLQSCLALLAQGVAVTVAGDAVASRDDLSRRLALARLARAGAEVAGTGEILTALAQPAATHDQPGE